MGLGWAELEAMGQDVGLKGLRTWQSLVTALPPFRISVIRVGSRYKHKMTWSEESKGNYISYKRKFMG